MDNTIQTLEITFRGNPIPETYEDVLGYQLGSGFVGVMTKEGKTIIFPQDLVEMVVHTQTEKE